MDGIDPDRLAEALRVLAEAQQLPPEHPDSIAVRRATGKIFKSVKEQRRAARRLEIRTNDDAVTAATATGAPGRIDDETAGIQLQPRTAGERAGTLLRARACYICKVRYVDVDAFYHQLCPDCAVRNHARRDARTDLTRPPRAAHRRPGEDRHVHRAAAAARRRPHDDHDALPERRRPALQRDGGQRGLDRSAADRRHRPARSAAGRRARRRGRGAGPARHPDQQRRPDRPALARGLRAPGRRRPAAAPERPAARDPRALQGARGQRRAGTGRRPRRR